MGKLYIIATPIGNLEDITVRALRILNEVDLILCEDMRVTKKLLNHYNIKTSTESYHQHSNFQKVRRILKFLEQGKRIALVSDSGTPGISDPGNELITRVIKLLPGTEIIPIPGPSAVAAVTSVSGFTGNKFVFLGFLPRKKGRSKIFQEITHSKYPVIIYESPHRILKTLGALLDAYTNCCGIENEPDVVIGKELTKKFEKIYRGKLSKVIEEMKNEQVKGEYVIAIKNRNYH